MTADPSGYDWGPGDDLDDAYDEGFYRGRVSAEGRSCCPHREDCPTLQRTWRDRLREWFG